MKRKVKISAPKWDNFVLQEQLKSLMYVDRSLRRYPNKDKFIDELNFKNCMRLNGKTTSKLFVGIIRQKRKFIIHPEYFDAKNIFSHPFIQNIKQKLNMVQDLSKQMNISLKKQILDNSVEHQIQQIQCITGRNGKTEYRGWTYVKNKVLLEPGWISDAFEFREPEFYKLVKTVTYYDESQKHYTVYDGQCNQQKSAEESTYEDKPESVLIIPG